MKGEESEGRARLRERGLYHAPIRESDIAMLDPERGRLRAKVRDENTRRRWLDQRRENALPLSAKLVRWFRRKARL